MGPEAGTKQPGAWAIGECGETVWSEDAIKTWKDASRGQPQCRDAPPHHPFPFLTIWTKTQESVSRSTEEAARGEVGSQGPPPGAVAAHTEPGGHTSGAPARAQDVPPASPTRDQGNRQDQSRSGGGCGGIPKVAEAMRRWSADGVGGSQPLGLSLCSWPQSCRFSDRKDARSRELCFLSPHYALCLCNNSEQSTCRQVEV